MKIHKPYLIFVGDAVDELAAKTSFGVVDWCRDDCLGQFRLPGCAADLKLKDLSMAQAAASGAKTVLIGVANRGGVIPNTWIAPLVEALEQGMSIANGLHTPLDSIAEIRNAAAANSGQLIEVRKPHGTDHIATGEPRDGHRLLTVGTDCSVGKMYTALALTQELQRRGVPADFRATGQTGIFIEGAGVPVDAVVADFIAGSVEKLCPAADAKHWDIIEGQGSLYHPSFAGVSLGLLHGAQADALVLCHEPTRKHMRGLPNRQIPNMSDVMEINLQAARMACPEVRFFGLAINTKHMSDQARTGYLSSLEDQYQLPCEDPFMTGGQSIIEHVVELTAATNQSLHFSGGSSVSST